MSVSEILILRRVMRGRVREMDGIGIPADENIREGKSLLEVAVTLTLMPLAVPR